MDKIRVQFQDWGRISYDEAWKRQTGLHEELKNLKISNRRNGWEMQQNHYLIFCEHAPVYTLGKSGKLDHLLLSDKEMAEKGIEFYKINRGGDITYHGPGQIVAYPIFDLDEMFTDVHKYVRYLEEAVIRTLDQYGLRAQRVKAYTGVWLPEGNGQPLRKICAIGVHLSRWVTMHGLAFNVNTDLNYFTNIVPCGIAEENMSVTSLSRELNREVSYKEVQRILKNEFQKLFEFEYA